MYEDAETVADRARDELGAARMIASSYPLQAFEITGKAMKSALRAGCMADGLDFDEDTPIDQLLAFFPDEAYGASSSTWIRAVLNSISAWISRGARGDDSSRALSRDIQEVAELVDEARYYVSHNRQKHAATM